MDQLRTRVEIYNSRPDEDKDASVHYLINDLWNEVQRLRALAGAVSEGAGDLTKIKADLAARDKAQSKADVKPNA